MDKVLIQYEKNFLLGKASSAIFQQDGPPPHFSRDIRQYIDKTFPNRWIERGGAPSNGHYTFLKLVFAGLFSMGIC